MSASTPNITPRLLLVDDNAAIHQDFRKILGGPAAASSDLQDVEEALFEKPKSVIGRVSFRVDSALQGQEALAMVQKALAANDPYTLIFMDIRMPPGWDGVETIGRIWQIYPDVQMVLCSAYSDYTWDDLLGRFGHTDNLLILKKPFETVEVLQIAHAMTKKWSLAHQSRLWMKDIDRLVRERTQELVIANEQLRAEIAERARIQTALQVSEERFSKAFRTNPVPMAILSRTDGRFLDANASFLQLSGRPATEILSRTSAELNLWVDQTGDRLSALDPGQHIRNHSCSLKSGDGSVRDVVLSAEPIALDCGPCVLLIAEDVTDQLRLESQLRQAQKMEAVGRLAAGVAHEFNNILTVIQGHADLLREPGMPPNQVAESSGRISQASQRAAALTRQLLTFSRQQPVQLKSIHLSTVVQSTERMLSQLVGERYKIQLKCPESLPTILADAGNIEQILINLSINARDAMPGGGTIRIQTDRTTLSPADASSNPDARPGDFITLTVSDTGSGINPDVLRRIFDPFFTTKEVGKGTGLGLSTVHGIVRQHKGWIEASSKVGQGSSFIVFLPVSVGSEIQTNQTDMLRRPDASTGSGEAVLLVEDDPSVRDLARTALQHGGYRVFEAADGTSAMQVWNESAADFSILVTDIVLPNGPGGGKLAQTLLDRKPELRVIYISGYGAESLRDELPASFDPAVNFLSKPFDPRMLLKAVNAETGVAAAAHKERNSVLS